MHLGCSGRVRIEAVGVRKVFDGALMCVSSIINAHNEHLPDLEAANKVVRGLIQLPLSVQRCRLIKQILAVLHVKHRIHAVSIAWRKVIAWHPHSQHARVVKDFAGERNDIEPADNRILFFRDKRGSWGRRGNRRLRLILILWAKPWDGKNT